MSVNAFKIHPLGDHALTIEFGDSIDLTTNQRVMAMYEAITRQPFEGLLDLVPAYCTLTIVFDLAVARQKAQPHQTTMVYIEHLLHSYFAEIPAYDSGAHRVVDIPVCYHPLLAPDLEWLAHHHHLTTQQVIQLHTSVTYQVYMLGFLPGFPYLASVPEGIATPRKNTPRKMVHAGSVGIAGQQTGIYPFESPGGWQLVGCTPLKMFNSHASQPTLLQPGDQVRFYAITVDEFEKMRWQ